MSMLDDGRIAATPLEHVPYDHLVVVNFVPHDPAVAAAASFPAPDLPGALPAPSRPRDDARRRRLSELRTPRLTSLFAA